MLNNVQLIGNLTKDIELRQTGNGFSVTQFSIAVSRDVKNAEGEYESDFIECVAWRGTAEYLAKYYKKGNRIAVSGRLQKRQFETEHGTKYVTEVIVDKVYNLTPRETITRVESTSDDAYAETVKALAVDDDLPF